MPRNAKENQDKTRTTKKNQENRCRCGPLCTMCFFVTSIVIWGWVGLLGQGSLSNTFKIPCQLNDIYGHDRPSLVLRCQYCASAETMPCDSEALLLTLSARPWVLHLAYQNGCRPWTFLQLQCAWPAHLHLGMIGFDGSGLLHARVVERDLLLHLLWKRHKEPHTHSSYHGSWSSPSRPGHSSRFETLHGAAVWHVSPYLSSSSSSPFFSSFSFYAWRPSLSLP